MWFWGGGQPLPRPPKLCQNHLSSGFQKHTRLGGVTPPTSISNYGHPFWEAPAVARALLGGVKPSLWPQGSCSSDEELSLACVTEQILPEQQGRK
jgi:hypothetical protein